MVESASAGDRPKAVRARDGVLILDRDEHADPAEM